MQIFLFSNRIQSSCTIFIKPLLPINPFRKQIKSNLRLEQIQSHSIRMLYEFPFKLINFCDFEHGKHATKHGIISINNLVETSIQY